MVIGETDINGDQALQAAKADWGHAEVDPAVAYERALGICDNLRAFVAGERDRFMAYFVQGVYEQSELEMQFLRILGINDSEDVISEEPRPILVRDGITLYKWCSVIFDGKAFDTFYEALRPGQESHLYPPRTSDPAPQTGST